MTPEQLIVELEAALHQGEGHDWRLLAPLVLDVLKSMQAAHERLTAERDVAREFYGEWRGIADQRQSDLDELRADAWAMICDATNDQNAAAENRARRDRDFREANRLVEDLRAELAKAGESIRAYERMIDDVAEKASALACEEVKAEFLRRDTIARLQAAEIEALKNELARLTAERDQAVARNAFLHNETGKALEIIAGRIELNPPISADEQSDIEAVARWVKAIGAEQVARLMKERDAARAELARLTTLRPIEEAPKDGTSMLCWCPGYGWRHLYWDHVWLLVGAPCDEYEPTQFLSLPVKP